MCMLLGADMFRIPSKIDHICQYMKLPVVPPDLMPPPPGLPALLVINLQVTATPRDLLSCRLAPSRCDAIDTFVRCVHSGHLHLDADATD